MSDLQPKIAYFRLTLAQEPERTHETIRKAVDGGPFALTREEADKIIRHLEASFDITQRRGSAVSSEFRPWLEARRSDIDFFYWDRLKRYFLETDALPPQVVSVLNDETDEILDYSGNPINADAWKRRGMVIGHVQSGKTTNYASLICKAADAGYKIVILLAGITNALRQQTQERIDEYFIGKKSVFQAVAQEPLTIVNYAVGRRFPAFGTSRDRDFSKVAATTGGVTLSALNEPIIFVTKKNKSTLEHLADWLGDAKIREPLLLIDDEADNASINTSAHPNRVTAINQAIRTILGKFDRSTYVGYTATPFANIFIDPDTEHAMLQDDLFPRHFIKALDPPSNYMGASRFFGDPADPTDLTVQVVSDYDGLLPLTHRRDARPAVLPESLRKAVRVFLLARAVRIQREQGSEHCSMMINVTRFNDVQDHVFGLVYRYLEELKNAIGVNGGLGRKALADRHITELKETHESEYPDLGSGFLKLLPLLDRAASSIRVTVVNMRGGVLDYRRHQNDGLHVIAIGGLALSRGLTLEGLTVSYLLRNAGASDTLMQMARWFGYRPHYEDLCRLYLPSESRDHYEFITRAIEELRTEIKQMERLGLTPENFGLKVRHSPAAIRITAANKMRNASSLMLAQDYSGRMVEGFALKNDDDVNTTNSGLVRRFLAQLAPPDAPLQPTLYWTNVEGAKVMSLLQDFTFSEVHQDLGPIQGPRSLFADYVEDRLVSELALWDVAIPAYLPKSDESPVDIAGCRRKLVTRAACLIKGDALKLTSKNKAANPGDEKIGLATAAIDRAEATGERGASKYCRERVRPLLLVHIVKASGVKASGQTFEIKAPVMSLSFCMPTTGTKAVAREYMVNMRYRQLLLDSSNEPEDDEGILDEAGNV